MTNMKDAQLALLGEQDHAADWDALEDVTADFTDLRPRKDRQLNLRVDQELLDTLRALAARRGIGYHSLARDLIDEGLARAAYEHEVHQPANSTQGRPFRMKEVILLLLGAPGASGRENEAIVGRTRLQKLLFLTAQHLQPHIAARFEAYDYGPFEESVAPDIEFLADEGLVQMPGHGATGTSAAAGDAEYGKGLLAWVHARHGPEPDQERPTERYRLTQQGMDWVRRFVASGGAGNPEALMALQQQVAALKQQYGKTPLSELVELVYAEYPEFTEHSKISHQVAERRARRGTQR